MKRVYRISSAVILVCAGIMGGICVIELCLRIWMKEYAFERMVFKQHEWNAISRVYRPSRDFGYEIIPHATAAYNALGMRDKEYAIDDKPAGVFRILLLGDSICESGMWSDYLEDMFMPPGSCQILNAATSAWGAYQYYQYMKLRAPRLKADLVLLGLCLNDVPGRSANPVIFTDPAQGKQCFYNIRDRAGNTVRPVITIRPALYRRSYLYRYVVTNFLARQWDPHEEKGVDLLRGIRRMADGRVVAVIFPYLKPLREYTAVEMFEYTETVSALRAAGIPFYDLTALFNRSGRDIIRWRAWPADKIHFNDEANHMKALAIYPWLLRQIAAVSPASRAAGAPDRPGARALSVLAVPGTGLQGAPATDAPPGSEAAARGLPSATTRRSHP